MLYLFKKALRERGWVLTVFGGGITGDLQVNDTHLHHPLKTNYRIREEIHYRELLKQKPDKIPTMDRDTQMKLITGSYDEIIESGTFDPALAYKQNFLTVAFDGSEDHLVSFKLMELVGDEMKKFRDTLVSSGPATNLSALIKSITPPKGVKFKTPAEPLSRLEDEGQELLSNEFSLDPEEEFRENDPRDEEEFDLVIDEDEEIAIIVTSSEEVIPPSKEAVTPWEEGEVFPTIEETVPSSIDEKFH